MEQLYLFLFNKGFIVCCVVDIMKMKFIVDWLFLVCFDVIGGGIFYEIGELVFVDGDFEVVGLFGEYLFIVFEDGIVVLVKIDKWGLDMFVFDEKIVCQGCVFVDCGIQCVLNLIICFVDFVVMVVIVLCVLSMFNLVVMWDIVGDVVEVILMIQVECVELGFGFEFDIVVLCFVQYVKVIGMLINDKVFLWEIGVMVIQGNLFVDVFGFIWVIMLYFQGVNLFLVDCDNFGGMVDEKFGGFGYVFVGDFGVEVKFICDDDVEGYKFCGCCVMVFVVIEFFVGVQLVGMGF